MTGRRYKCISWKLLLLLFSLFISGFAIIFMQSKFISYINVDTSELLSLEKRRDDLQKEIDNYVDVINALKEDSNRLDVSDGVKVECNNPFQYSNFKSTKFPLGKGVCSQLSLALPSVETIWRKYTDKILEASFTCIPSEMESWLRLLHQRMSPTILSQSIKSLPDAQQFRRVLDILQTRLNYGHEHGNFNDANAPPKLKILVFGGSVTLGVNCGSNPLDLKFTPMRRNCAWPNRLENFFNSIFGYEVVEVYNNAMGGTDSRVGSWLYEYDLLPDSMKYPHVIINAYSSNDMHILTTMRAKAEKKTLSEALFELIQHFIRVVETSKKCRDQLPLLIYLDDYLGNEQNEILNTMAFSSSMTSLAQYYGVMSISYADSVRRFVYADTKESWFSPDWYSSDGVYERQVHPSLGAHISIMWVISFNLLNSFLLFCNEEAANANDGKNYQIAPSQSDKSMHPFQGVDSVLNNDMRQAIRNWPSQELPGIIPELTINLTLQEVSSLWNEASVSCLSQHDMPVDSNDDKGNQQVCPFSWLANTHKMDKVIELNGVLKDFIINNNGWDATKDHGKLGFVPSSGQIGAEFTIELKSVQKPIEKMHLFVLKSYGDLWARSEVEVYIEKVDQSGVKTLHQTRIKGFHENEISIAYRYEFNFKDFNEFHKVGDNIRMRVVLVGGETFKIVGMAFCYR